MLDGSFAATQFYADIIGHPEDEEVARALDELGYYTDMVKILGVYPAGLYVNGRLIVPQRSPSPRADASPQKPAPFQNPRSSPWTAPPAHFALPFCATRQSAKTAHPAQYHHQPLNRQIHRPTRRHKIIQIRGHNPRFLRFFAGIHLHKQIGGASCV